jgi:post-segregation antitoxin (ccd killing protein)
MTILYTHYRYCQGAIAIILCASYADPMSRPSLNRDRLQLTMPKPLVEALRAMALLEHITMSAVVERALRAEHERWKRTIGRRRAGATAQVQEGAGANQVLGEFDAEGREQGTPTHPKSAATTFSGQQGELPDTGEGSDTPTHPESGATQIQGQLPEAI